MAVVRAWRSALAAPAADLNALSLATLAGAFSPVFSSGSWLRDRER